MEGLYEGLKDKNVLVTGGASGIDLTTAKTLVATHSNVFIVGRSEKSWSLLKNNCFRLSRELAKQTPSQASEKGARYETRTMGDFQESCATGEAR
jgi:NAD(P)-dependent dehydrogenase (short-subunit alcohol dehydrogenase family)